MYTKGPWVKDGLQWYGRNGEMVVMSDGPSFGSAAVFKQAKANANLIAAAPELLEALEELLNEASHFAKAIPAYGNSEAIAKSIKAIAKAKGIDNV